MPDVIPLQSQMYVFRNGIEECKLIIINKKEDYTRGLPTSFHIVFILRRIELLKWTVRMSTTHSAIKLENIGENEYRMG